MASYRHFYANKLFTLQRKKQRSSLVKPYELLMSKRIVPLLFFLFLVCQLFGQSHVRDSLELKLRTLVDGQTKVDVLNQLSYQYYDFNDSIALKYSQEALALALKNNYKKGIKLAFTLVGLGYSSQSKYKEAIANYRLADHIKEPEDQDNTIFNLVLLGKLYRDIAKYDSAFLVFGQAFQNTRNIHISNALCLRKGHKAKEEQGG